MASAGLPVSTVAGVRLALEPGSGRSAVPVRSAILGAVLAITVVTGTFTFGSSLDTLVSHPSLYGWNWNSMLLSGFSGDEDLPQHEATTLLEHDPYVSGISGMYFGALKIDGQTVPVLGGSPGAPVQPPLLSGHGFDAANQVVLGATTLADLHARVGDTVQVSNGVTKPIRSHCGGNGDNARDRHPETAPGDGVRSAVGLRPDTGHRAQPPGKHRPGTERVPHPLPAGSQPDLGPPLPESDRRRRSRRRPTGRVGWSGCCDRPRSPTIARSGPYRASSEVPWPPGQSSPSA